MVPLYVIIAASAACAAACMAARAFGVRAGRRGGGMGRYWKRVRAEVLGVAPEASTLMGPDLGGARYVLVCGCVDPVTGDAYTFRAGGLAWEGRPLLPGSSVTVYVDPDSGYRDYRIDLDSLSVTKAAT